MRTLSTLIRLYQHRLDERRRELGDLERLRADLLSQRERLEKGVLAEQEAAKRVEVGAFAYGGFARGVVERRAKLAASLAELEARIEVAQNAVHGAFQDVKRYELVRQARKRKQREELNRRQQAQLDEISLQMHRRRSA